MVADTVAEIVLVPVAVAVGVPVGVLARFVECLLVCAGQALTPHGLQWDKCVGSLFDARGAASQVTCLLVCRG